VCEESLRKFLPSWTSNFPKELIEYEAKAVRIHFGESVLRFETEHTLVYMTSHDRNSDSYLAEKAVEAGAELKDRSPVRSVEATAKHTSK